MTIIEPNKNYIFNPFLILSAVFLIFMAILGIWLYNQNVNLRHAISESRKNLQEQSALNADLKNKYYQILNNRNIEGVVKQKGLIPDKNPIYLENKALTLKEL
jgi:cell division protein FtsL